MTRRRIETDLIHAGEPSPRFAGAVTPPIFQSSTFEPSHAAGEDDIRYLRLSNTPNHEVLHAKLAALEGGEAALVTSSGMAAISATLLTVARPGDHLLMDGRVYGGTRLFAETELRALGIAVTFVAVDHPDGLATALRPNTVAIYCETIGNPLMNVADLPAVVSFARAHGLVSIIDNTFATPVLARPIEHGIDLVLHSATKYLNGHSDVVAGVVVGRAEQVTAIRRRLNLLGGALDPHACFLLHRGLKTLAVRVRHQCASAQTLAEALARRSDVVSVRYPGLVSHPGHTRARELLAGFGGMIAFEVESETRARRAIARLRLAIEAPSLGGTETLVSRPSGTSHVTLEPSEREALGIRDGLVRVSVGLEAVEDLIEDFEQALGS